MGRHAKLDRPVKLHFSIPSSVWEEVEEELKSPLTGKIPSGERSALATRLFRRWLKERREASEAALESIPSNKEEKEHV